MILEQLPEVQRLSDEAKRQLAEELWWSVADTAEVEAPPELLVLLEERLAEHEADPSAVSSWEQVKARIFPRHGA